MLVQLHSSGALLMDIQKIIFLYLIPQVYPIIVKDYKNINVL